MPSGAFIKFRHNLNDVERLIKAHNELSPNHRGKRALGHINRSGVIMLCAAWEVYCEEALVECVKYIAANLNEPNQLPTPVKKHLSKLVKDAKVETKPMELAGDGWRNLYIAYCQQESKSVNSPKTTVLEPLYKRFIGLSELSNFWAVGGQYITGFVATRGDIAHNGRSAEYVKINQLIEYKDAILATAKEMDNQLCTYTFSLLPAHTRQPWRRMP
ncbi:hypothetical protein QNE50_004563 [Vibrio parahaemolyticus]|nr:hypothetical protein [Vibrio parahaemolyticus]